MSRPSPAKTNSGDSSLPPPRQIRFVSSDGLPQTKRRRVTAACLTCRKRKIRCSGEQPVCKTCLDYGHPCLGYTESLPHVRSHSDTAATKTPTLSRASSFPGPGDDTGAESRGPQTAPINPLRTDISQDSEVYQSRDGTSGKHISSGSGAVLEHGIVGQSPESNRTSTASTAVPRTHVPYFRYFGPTAIVPGFKQMVVQLRGPRKGNQSLSSDSLSPLRSPTQEVGPNSLTGLITSRDSNTIPFYDPEDSLPVSTLVVHLCEVFFVHLGCNFPFLQHDRFMRDLKDKKVDTMLVDAICALAARLTTCALLSPPQALSIDPSEVRADSKMSDRGQPFAHRAMSALVDALTCPTLSAVQACLLLAYEEFGSNHDSGLWMYLGISIRMAQDLGIQKIQGLKHNYGRTGLTPSAVKTGHFGRTLDAEYDRHGIPQYSTREDPLLDDERAFERERVDSFWSIFFLDRVISSGTGRPVTLRDEDIELCFPLQSESQLPNGWPSPFPPLIRVIHLYGRVTDLINAIQTPDDFTSDTLKRLAGMESDLTAIYQRLSSKLHFNASNFQAYVKANEGTNFILLHFWFHTLIVLLHQPMLLSAFGGTMQQLYPNSRELSMSSAKTIADILSFSELIDGKSFIGNPFTSQPMYIAACAFLMESAYYSSPSSRTASPPLQTLRTSQSSTFVLPNMDSIHVAQRKPNARHILLASAAKENYQRCYNALKSLETYWEGTRYILTVLDQKATGILDPLLYTAEEMQSASDAADAQLQHPGVIKATQAAAVASARSPAEGERSPKLDPSQAIGWALTGATDSAQPNFSLLYQLPAQSDPNHSENVQSPQQQNSHDNQPVETDTTQRFGSAGQRSRSSRPPPASRPRPRHEHTPPDQSTTSDASLLLGLNPQVPVVSRSVSGHQALFNHPTTRTAHESFTNPYHHYSSASTSEPNTGQHTEQQNQFHHPLDSRAEGDVLIESQDIDMHTLQQQGPLPFSFNSDIIPWLEYLPQDVLNYFGEQQQGFAFSESHDA